MKPHTFKACKKCDKITVVWSVFAKHDRDPLNRVRNPQERKCHKQGQNKPDSTDFCCNISILYFREECFMWTEAI